MRWHPRNLPSIINQSIKQPINRFLGGIKKKWLSFNHLILLKSYLPTFDFIIFNIWSKNWSTLGDKNRWKEGRTEKFFSQMSFLHFYRIVITKPYLKLELNVFPQKREKKAKILISPTFWKAFYSWVYILTRRNFILPKLLIQPLSVFRFS